MNEQSFEILLERTYVASDWENFALASYDDVFPKQIKLLKEELLTDAKIADSKMLPCTFWIGPNDEPRCLLEQLALQIFGFHAKDRDFNPQLSGAEWWIQLKQPGERLNFHWDKDEVLKTECNLYTHPQISTVTYFCEGGAPTVITPGTISYVGEINQEPLDELHCIYPKFNKHMAFDGRLLHGVVPELTKDQNPIRFTFLVNVWLNYLPQNITHFPSSLVSKLSPCLSDLHFNPSQPTFCCERNITKGTEARFDIGEEDSSWTLRMFCPPSQNDHTAPGTNITLKYSHVDLKPCINHVTN